MIIKNINNHLILGYYCHLLTDNFYNNFVYSNCWIQNNNHDIIGIKLKNGKVKTIDIKDKKRLKRKYKHNDFELYGKYLFEKDDILPIFNENEILLNIKYLKNNFLNEDLVKQRIDYLNNDFKKQNKLSIKEKIFKHKYLLFQKKELDVLLDDCIKYIITEFKKIGL